MSEGGPAAAAGGGEVTSIQVAAYRAALYTRMGRLRVECAWLTYQMNKKKKVTPAGGAGPRSVHKQIDNSRGNHLRRWASKYSKRWRVGTTSRLRYHI